MNSKKDKKGIKEIYTQELRNAYQDGKISLEEFIDLFLEQYIIENDLSYEDFED